MKQKSIYDFTAVLIDGKKKSLRDYKGKVLLIVNTASECGFTPQYQGLQEIYERYHPRGFEILAFPCDQFGHQEPGTEKQIQSFCRTNYGVRFPVFAKVNVNDPEAHPVYRFLKSRKGGLFGDDIKWNFTKFLVDKNGEVVERYAPQTIPIRIAPDIERLLAE